MTSWTTPVLIVGGGPVGLAAALELAHHDVASVVIEPRTEVSWLRPRAKTTSARTMEHFRRWGIAEVVRERAPLKPSWSDEVVFCTTVLGREVTRFDQCFGLHLQGAELVAEAGQQAPQPLIESVMRDAVATLPDVELVTGSTVTAIVEDDVGVEATVQDELGAVYTIRAQYALGCDGPRSMMRDAIGATMEGTKDGRPNFNIVFRSDALASRLGHRDAVHHWVLNPEQSGVVGRLDLVDQWWCIALGVDAERGAAETEAIVRRLLGDEHGDLPIDIVATDPWRARMQLADRFGRGRIFLAGDAAHLNPPWGGHGFNTGIGDAVNVGWKLAAVLDGWASPSLLDSYELERRPVAADTIAVAATNMATLSAELSDPRLVGSDEEFASIRPAIAEVIRRTKDSEFHSLDLVLGTAYPSSPVVADSVEPALASDASTGDAEHRPSAAPGHRLPHHWMAPGRSLYDLLGRDFTLVGEVRGPTARRLAGAAAQLGIPMAEVELAPDTARGWFDASLVLVRPDQHVAWRGDGLADADLLLRRVTGHPTAGDSIAPATTTTTTSRTTEESERHAHH
jgi:2-polyprenyl-6-methoxyphenol hydroxylase-like FAD-dependent oxidoreductase